MRPHHILHVDFIFGLYFNLKKTYVVSAKGHVQILEGFALCGCLKIRVEYEILVWLTHAKINFQLPKGTLLPAGCLVNFLVQKCAHWSDPCPASYENYLFFIFGQICAGRTGVFLLGGILKLDGVNSALMFWPSGSFPSSNLVCNSSRNPPSRP
jgi:hypothetical protein